MTTAIGAAIPNKLFPALLVLLAALFLASCGRVDLSATMHQAVELTRQGEFAQAAELTRICLQENPQFVEAILLDSYCRLQLDEKEEQRRKALYNLAKSTRLAPEKFDCWFFYGWALVQTDHTRTAIEPLNTAYRLLPPKSPHRGKVQQLLAYCYIQNNLQDKAMSVLQPLQRNPAFRSDPLLYNSLGILALKRQNPRRALHFFQQGLIYSPDDPMLLQNIGVTYDLHLNQPQEAIRWYRQTLRACSIAQGDSANLQHINRLMRRIIQLNRVNRSM